MLLTPASTAGTVIRGPEPIKRPAGVATPFFGGMLGLICIVEAAGVVGQELARAVVAVIVVLRCAGVAAGAFGGMRGASRVESGGAHFDGMLQLEVGFVGVEGEREVGVGHWGLVVGCWLGWEVFGRRSKQRWFPGLQIARICR